MKFKKNKIWLTLFATITSVPLLAISCKSNPNEITTSSDSEKEQESSNEAKEKSTFDDEKTLQELDKEIHSKLENKSSTDLEKQESSNEAKGDANIQEKTLDNPQKEEGKVVAESKKDIQENPQEQENEQTALNKSEKKEETTIQKDNSNNPQKEQENVNSETKKDSQEENVDNIKNKIEKILNTLERNIKVKEENKVKSAKDTLEEKKKFKWFQEYKYIDIKDLLSLTDFQNIINLEEYSIEMNKDVFIDVDNEWGKWKNVTLKIFKDKNNEYIFENVNIIGFKENESEKSKMLRFLTKKELDHTTQDFYPSLVGMLLYYNDNNVGYTGSESEPEIFYSSLSTSWENRYFETSGKYQDTLLNVPLKNKFFEMDESLMEEFQYTVNAVKFDDIKGILEIKVKVSLREGQDYSDRNVFQDFKFDGFRKIDPDNGAILLSFNNRAFEIFIKNELKNDANNRYKKTLEKALTNIADNKEMQINNIFFLKFLEKNIKKNLLYRIKNIENSPYKQGAHIGNLNSILSNKNIAIYPNLMIFPPEEIAEIKNIKLIKKDNQKHYVVIEYLTSYLLGRYNTEVKDINPDNWDKKITSKIQTIEMEADFILNKNN